uniref:Efflux RND transporter permease subunit n=1 Tax=Desulfomonile tiedjei TaxID=2358 RepID=A0A7C4EXR6_9BACT
MWIVRLALRRPYTVAVMSMLIFVMGLLSLSRMTVDIFPTIDIPLVVVVWSYPGLSPEDVERRIVLISERAYSTTVNGIQRIESDSIPGIGILRIYFYPGADIGAAIAQISSVSSTLLRIAPPGTQPPNVIQFNASNVPVAQLTVSSETLSEEKIFDYGLNFIRVRLFTIPGLSTPAPFGGKSRQINVDVDAAAMASRGLSPADIVNALLQSNVILPAGTAKIGQTEYNVLMNSSPKALEEFNRFPVKVIGDAVVYLGDVAKVSDGYAEQTNIVRVDGRKATYLAILKHADASTLAVVNATREALPLIKGVAPQGLELKIDFDQSIFVRTAIEGVLREVTLASILVSLMIFVFLGSLRSMIIVIVSIPLAILTSITALFLAGYTINIMTLGGLALAVGMLVDDATVEVENIHRNRRQGKPLTVAILDGARQVAVPAIVGTLAVCVVFFPVVLLYGPAKYLFTPLALAVVVAMLASYLLSRTLVPTLARMLMAGENLPAPHQNDDKSGIAARSTLREKITSSREKVFARLQMAYAHALETCMAHRLFTLVIAGIVFVLSLALVPVIGADFFPYVDAGLMKLHVRAPAGTRIEETDRIISRIEERIRNIIPPKDLSTINVMIGVPVSYNLGFVQTDNIGGMDADVLIALKQGHEPSITYQKQIREIMERDFPQCSYYFQPADIVTQVLNFGVSSPIDVQIEGMNLQTSYGFALKLRDLMARIPGVADIHIKQVLDYPSLQVDVDRTLAAKLGMTMQNVASSMLVSLSSSSLVSPSFYLNPENNVNYFVAVRIPPSRIRSIQDLDAIPITPPLTSSNLVTPADSPSSVSRPTPPSETLANVANIRHTVSCENINHYTVQRVINVDANVEGRDLGSVAKEIKQAIVKLGALPPGTRISLRGQYEVMEHSFESLGMGLVLAILFVYLLMVVLFQSWLDPFIIIMAIPGALVGIIWMLGITGVTINVESLMGSIMAVGVATANSILLVSFANDFRTDSHASPIEAALAAGKTRLRPVLMTALAMILGMLPMAVGVGEAGEQNAPLGRAVIGGLLVATITTLFIVPVIYSLLRKKLPSKAMLEKRFLAEEKGETWRATNM